VLLCYFTFHSFGREIYRHPVYFEFRFIKDMKRNFQARFFQNDIFEIVAVLNRGTDIIASLVSADSKNEKVLESYSNKFYDSVRAHTCTLHNVFY